VTKTQTAKLVSYVVTTIARIFTREQVTKTTAVLIQKLAKVKILVGAIQIWVVIFNPVLPVTNVDKDMVIVKQIKTVGGDYFAGKITARVNLDLIPHKAFPGKERMTAVPTIAITAIRPTGFRFHGEHAVHLPIHVHSPTGTVTKTLTAKLVSFVVTTIARIFTLELVTKTTAVFTLMEEQAIAPVYGVTPIQAIKQMEIPSYQDVRQILVSGVARNIGHVLWEEETAAVMMTARKV